MRIRPALRGLHRWLGLVIAAFLCLAGVTGAILVFQDEIDALLNPTLFVDPAGSSHQPMSTTELLRKVEQQVPEVEVYQIPLRHDVGFARLLPVRSRIDAATGKAQDLGFNELFISPIDGKILGRREWGALRIDRQHLIPFIYKLHMSLHLPGKWGAWIMGGAAIVWLLNCFLGFYLTLPAKLAKVQGRAFWRKWKPAWQIKWRGGASRTFFDLHRATGLYLWIIFAAVSVSGVYLNLREEVFNPLLALVSPVSSYPTAHLPISHNVTDVIDHDSALRAAQLHLPPQSKDLSPSSISFLPDYTLYRVSFDHADRFTAWFRVRYLMIFIDARSGEARAFHGTDTGTIGDVIAAIQFPLHSGQFLGLFGRILICFSGLLVTLLSITGVVIWWRKSSVRARKYAFA